MLTVSIHTAETQLSRLLDAAASGEEVIIAKGGKPVARLVAIEAAVSKRQLDSLAGKLRVSPDFDDPLPADIAADFEGR